MKKLSDKNKTRFLGLILMVATGIIFWLFSIHTQGLVFGVVMVGCFFLTLFGLVLTLTGDIKKSIDSVITGAIWPGN